MLEVSKHITFDPQNHDTWSENLASLLILTGSAVDTFFRDMKDCSCVQKEISFVNVSQKVGRGRWDINDFRDAYEPIYEFSQNEIHVPFGLSSYPPIKPFNEFQSKGIPDWWDAYNGVKHEYYHSIRRATLDNVLNALGGLLILHALHKCSQEYLIRSGHIQDIYKSLRWEQIVEAFKESNTGCPKRWKTFFDIGIQTSIFVFKYR